MMMMKKSSGRRKMVLPPAGIWFLSHSSIFSTLSLSLSLSLVIICDGYPMEKQTPIC